MSSHIGVDPVEHAKTYVFNHEAVKYTKDITRWREHMKFIFEWKKHFTSERDNTATLQYKVFFKHVFVNSRLKCF